MSALDQLTVAARRAAAFPTFRRGSAIILVLFHSPLLAQPVPLPAGGQDETVTLSPFVIEASADTGYLSSSTLAGICKA